MSPAELLTYVLSDEIDDGGRYGIGLCGKAGRVAPLLNRIASCEGGRERIREWIQTDGISIIDEAISHEMDREV